MRGYPFPFHDKTIAFTNWVAYASIGKKIDLCICLAGQAIGIKEVDDGIWLVSSMDYGPGCIDLKEKALQSLDNPFGSRVSPMS